MKLRKKGNRLFLMRMAKGYTILRLSKETGLSPGYISDLERGKKVNPSKKVMDILAEKLEVKREEIF